MVNHAITLLAERFLRLELHAAHSGREVLNALIKSATTSRAENITQLKTEIKEIIAFLLPVLPPYAPPLNSINQVMIVLEGADKKGTDLEEVQRQLASLSEVAAPHDNHGQIANHLIPVLPDKVTVYTHTLSETVLGVLLIMHQKGRIKQVFVTESRPNNDGWMTASQLTNAGVETRLTLDAAFPEVAERANVMLSGAEIINPDGSVVCKVGVYPAAMYCRMKSKPVYIIADTRKINPFNACYLNMTPISLENMGMIDIPDGLKAAGRYFDITPAEYVTGYGTESGLLTANDVYIAAKNQPVSVWLKSQLQSMQNSVV